MLDTSPDNLILHRHQILHPAVTSRPADADELARLAPWFALFGQIPSAADIACFHDGSGGHAPETLDACRSMMSEAGAELALLYRHCGVQAQPLDPLLPGLLRALDHRGPVHAIRRRQGDPSLSPGASERALVGAMMPPGGAVLLIDDLQERVAGRGALRPAPVVLSLFLCPLVRGASQ
jgi:hypothetical protein